MKITKFPELRNYLPIDIEKCEAYWNKKMNGFKMHSDESKDWAICKTHLLNINDNNRPITPRTFYLTVKVPFIIANFIIEGGAK